MREVPGNMVAALSSKLFLHCFPCIWPLALSRLGSAFMRVPRAQSLRSNAWDLDACFYPVCSSWWKVMRTVQTVKQYDKKKDVPLLWSALSGSCAGALAARPITVTPMTKPDS